LFIFLQQKEFGFNEERMSNYAATEVQIKSGKKSKCYKEFGLCDSTSNNKKKKMSETEGRCEVAIVERICKRKQ